MSARLKHGDRSHSVARDMRLRWKTVTPQRLSPAEVKALVEEWQARYSTSTVASRRNTLKRLLTFIDRTHRTFLAEAVPRVPPSEQRHITATNEEVSKLLAVAPTWMRAVILFARALGMRRGEIINLTPSNFDAQSRGLNFRRKSGGTSGLPVSPEIEKLILFASDQDPHERIIVTLGMPIPSVKPWAHTANRTAAQRLENAINGLVTSRWRAMVKKSGVNSNLHLHDLRHTAATEAFTETKDLRAVQQLLGHRSLASTMRYLAPLKTEELREQLKDINHAWLYSARPATEMKQ